MSFRPPAALLLPPSATLQSALRCAHALESTFRFVNVLTIFILVLWQPQLENFLSQPLMVMPGAKNIKNFQHLHLLSKLVCVLEF